MYVVAGLVCLRARKDTISIAWIGTEYLTVSFAHIRICDAFDMGNEAPGIG
jgi:hypothetical protein